MKTLPFILLTALTVKSFGQNNFIGVNVGINMTTTNPDNKILTDPKVIYSFTGGLSFDHIFKNHFLLSTDILYNRFGFKQYFDFTDNFGTSLGHVPMYDYYDYLSIPIKIGFKFGDKIFVTLNAGVVPSYLIDAKHMIDARNNLDISQTIGSEPTYNETSRVNRFDIGGIFEISTGAQFHKRYLIFTDIAYRQSFTSITNSNYFPDEQIKHYGLTLKVGIKYALTKD